MSKTIEQGKEEVVRLCKYFAINSQAFLAPGIKEDHVRQSLIDPFFEALGWDVHNTERTAPKYREVIPEDSVEVEGHQGAPDYAFCVGENPKFYAEAKKCSVNVGADPIAARQLRGYGFSGKLLLSVLTNFNELGVYDCTQRPRLGDKASHARIQILRYEEYPDRWREVWDVFSREAVWSGAFDQYAASKRKRGTSEVDVEFLKEIEGWRETVARNIALRNQNLHSDDLNAVVQLTIDRVVFLRMAEDRGFEPYEQLLKLSERPNIYRRFVRDLCRRADEKYNSGLFHFEDEKGVSDPPDRLTSHLTVDDKVFKPILQSLYFAHGSPYHFRVLPVEILGTIYERFLGKVIRLTEGHRAKVELKPEARKAGGVFYTPAYIVKYIVKHTVEAQVKGKSPAVLAGTKTKSPFRILDMACGSGSFLLGAYHSLLDHHMKWYLEHKPEIRCGAVYKDPRSGQWRLTIEEKKRILATHIFGVDIDRQAVEVTKLSLLLKVLEGETDQSLTRGLLPIGERALPNLAENIKWGNSLIGPDYFAGKLFSDPKELEHVNPFDWQQGFSDAMNDGGFDCIIGNPPWGASLMEGELEYLRARHKRVVARMIDSYIYFTDKALRLTKDNRPVGYIVPATLLNQVDAMPLRDCLLDRGMAVLVNMGKGVFGREVLNTSSIFVSGKSEGSLVLGDLSNAAIETRQTALASVGRRPYRQWEKAVKADPHHTFFTRNPSESALLQRLRRQFTTLASAIEGTIQRGVSPDVVAAHVVPNSEAERLGLEADLIRPSVSGSQIKRYQPWKSDQVVIYTTRHTLIDRHPRCRNYLENFKSENTCKEVKRKQHPWWALHRPRDPSVFASPKLIGLTTSRSIAVIYDESNDIVVTDAMYVFTPKRGINPKALMGIMQSKLFQFLYEVANEGEARVIPQIKASKLLTLPTPDLTSCGPLVDLVEKILDLHRHLLVARSEPTKEVIQRQIDATDEELDQLVFDLYSVTPEEPNGLLDAS